LPGAIIGLTTSLKVAPYRREKCAERGLDLKSTLIPGKGEETGCRTFPYVPGVLVCSDPYGCEELEVGFRPIDELR